MSLDKIIKEKAEVELDGFMQQAHKAISNLGFPLPTTDLARLISGHNTNTTRDACIKKLSEGLARQILQSIEDDDVS